MIVLPRKSPCRSTFPSSVRSASSVTKSPKVAQLPLLDMDYASIIEFIGRGVGGAHPTGLPIFNVLFRT